MAATAPLSVYLDSFITGFEQRTSLLRSTVTTQGEAKGNDFTFLIAKASRSAVTRGSNGLIPASPDDLAQVTVTMKEMHDLVQKTGFDIFRQQGDQMRIMQETGMKVINREIDDNILTALATTSVNVGAAATFSKTLVNKALGKLFNAEIENDGNITGVITPAAWMYLSDVTGFSSRDYNGGATPLVNGPQVIKWMNVNWIMHPRLTGVGTSSASCFLYHRDAVGHAVNVAGIQAKIGYHEEQDYSWARHSLYHNSKLLQGSGVVKVLHDDTAYS